MRIINYIRISITDRCNYRCTYCMPEEGVELKDHKEILTIEELITFVEDLVPLGIKNVRLTGGEPLVRKNVEVLIKGLRAIPGIEDITLTTNGALLKKYGKILKESGLTRVNVSLDTLNPEKFREITRVGNLEDVIGGLREAKRVGLTPVKVNVVVIKDFNDDELLDFVGFAIKEEIQVRFIELMPIGESDEEYSKKHFYLKDIKEEINKEFELMAVDYNTNGPSSDFQVKGTKGYIGFIEALSNHFCSTCNRIRLTAEGKIRLCLHKDIEYDIKPLLRENHDSLKVQEFMKEILLIKPEKHNMEEEGWGNQKRKMSQIGG